MVIYQEDINSFSTALFEFSHQMKTGCNPGFGHENKTLFVGCLDPKTNDEDLLNYFGPFDEALQVKLVWNHQTNTSKQCALLFCSSIDRANEILRVQHKLHDRILRVKYADEEKKGTKMAQLFYLQASGIPVNTPQEDVENAFSFYPDYHSFRFIQGTHHKQKWVAKVAFTNQASMKNLLAAQSHVMIGDKLCKIVEFQNKGSASAHSDTYSTQSSHDENENVHRMKKLEHFSLPVGQFNDPFSSGDGLPEGLCLQHAYPQAGAGLNYMNQMFKSSPGEPLSQPSLSQQKLFASTPQGWGSGKPEPTTTLHPPRNIFVPELATGEDDELLKLFSGTPVLKKLT